MNSRDWTQKLEAKLAQFNDLRGQRLAGCRIVQKARVKTRSGKPKIQQRTGKNQRDLSGGTEKIEVKRISQEKHILGKGLEHFTNWHREENILNTKY